MTGNDMPVITTRWNAIPEIVTDRYNGLVIPVKDEKALLKAIKEMDGIYHPLKENISPYFDENFNSDIVNPFILKRIMSC